MMTHSLFPRPIFAAAAAGAACLTMASPAQAEDLLRHDAVWGQALSDAELSDMRGKFVRPDNVSFFGITMLTSWQDAQGITTNARLVFRVDFLNTGSDGKPVPALMIGWEREGDPTMDVTDTHSGYVPYLAADEVLPVGGIATHQGAAQANIIAGTGNSARNGMQIAIIPASSLPALSMAGLQSANGTTQLGFADGDQLRFVLGDNNVGIVMTGTNGLDSSIQSLGGDIGQMLQQTMLNSNGNSVLNNASIVLGADNLGQHDTVHIENAISAMKGHGF